MGGQIVFVVKNMNTHRKVDILMKNRLLTGICAVVLMISIFFIAGNTAFSELLPETYLSLYFADATMAEGKSSSYADNFFANIAAIAMSDLNDQSFFSQLSSAVDKGYNYRVFVSHEKGMPDTDLAMIYCFQDSSWLLKDRTSVDQSVYIDASWEVSQGLNLKSKPKQLVEAVLPDCDGFYECKPKEVWEIYMEFVLFIEERNKTIQKMLDGTVDNIPEMPEEIENWPLDIPVSVQLPKEFTILEACFTVEPAGNVAATFESIPESQRFAGTVDSNNMVSGTLRFWEAGPHLVRLIFMASINNQKQSLSHEINIDTSNIHVLADETDQDSGLEDNVEPCEEHTWFDIDISDQVYAIYPPNPNYHYLMEAHCVRICEVCGQTEQDVLVKYTPEDTPVILEHTFDDGNYCTAPGCIADKPTEPTITVTGHIILPNNGRLHPDDDYDIYLEWQPEDVELTGITWKPIAIDENEPCPVTITKMDNASCEIHTGNSGFAYIQAINSDGTVLDKRAIAIVNEEEELDVERYYQILSQVAEWESALDYPHLVDMILQEYARIGRAEVGEEMIRLAKNAPKTYQDLFVWSFFDYVRDGQPAESGSYYEYGRIQSDTDRPNTWFHEIGHAIDLTLYNSNEAISQEDSYRSRLYDALYNNVSSIVDETIRETVGTSLTAEECNDMIDYFMGHEYLYSVTVGNAEVLIKQIFSSAKPLRHFEPIAPDWFTQNQKSVFKQCVDALYARTKSFSGGSSDICQDMLTGFTNQSAMSYDRNNEYGLCPVGHGPGIDIVKNKKNYQQYYWYDEDGNPTYKQNAEAWAEYYSSRMTGSDLSTNLEAFPEACRIMDEMAVDMLNRYKEKHLSGK